MLVRNIAGININDARLGLVPPVAGSPFAFGTDAGQIASPVNVQSDIGPSQGYVDATNILTGSIAGGSMLPSVTTPTNAAPNVVSVSNDSGISLGTLLLMGGAVAGTLYLISKPKSRGKVTGTKKGNYAAPLLIGAGALAIYFLSRNSNAAAALVNPVVPVAALPAVVPAASSSIWSKNLSLIQQL